jgi:hypothetical protein
MATVWIVASNPVLNPAAASNDPATVPMENTPWNAAMMGRSYSRSTSTAAAFIDTSAAPTAMPKTKAPRMASHRVEARSGTFSSSAMAVPDTTATARLPRRSINAPLNCIASRDPAPRTIRTVPSWAVEMSARCCRVGRCTAQVDSSIPNEAKNAKTVERQSTRVRFWLGEPIIRGQVLSVGYRGAGSVPPRRCWPR